MRTQHLFVITIGLLPLAVFALTTWLTNGAPFRPVDHQESHINGIGRVLPTATRAGPVTHPVWMTQSGADTEREYLYRMARNGDRGAALLLTVLDDGGVGARRFARISPDELIPRP